MDLVIPDFDFELSEEEIEKIILIHNNKMISSCDKSFIYSIITFISGKSSFKDAYESNVNMFLEFCLKKDVYNSNNFTLILNRIRDELKKVINRFHSYEEKETLKKKIMLYISSGVIDKYSFKILNSLLYCDINNVSTSFIVELFKNEKLSTNIEKRNIIFRILLKGKVSNSFSNYELYNSFWGLLSNDIILSFDNEKFEKFVRFALTNINAYILLNFLNECYSKKENEDKKDNDKKDVEEKKDIEERIMIIIDYIYNLLERHPYKPPLVDDRVLKASLSLIPLSIISQLSGCSNEKLKETLDTITNSKRFVSTSIVLSKQDLDEKRKEFILSLLNESDITEDELNPNMNREFYKYTLSYASISPLLECLSFDEYKQILVVLNEYIICNDKQPNNDVLRGIIDVLNNPSFSNMDYLTLRYILYMIIKTNSKEMASFINNDILNYYSTGEFVRALRIVEDNLKSSNLIAIKKLLTNRNLPNMTIDEKQEMFRCAWSRDIDLIVSLTNELNTLGTRNRNKERLIKALRKEG